MKSLRSTFAALVPSFIVSSLMLLALAGGGCSDKGPAEKVAGTGLGAVEGFVTLNGDPIETAVPLELRAGDDVVETRTTDAAAAFSFENVAPGEYELFVVPPAGYAPDAPLRNPIPVRVEANRTAEVLIPLVESSSLPDGKIRAYVSGDGAPMAGVNVTIFENNSASSIATTATNENGFAEFPLASGLYDVGIEIPEGLELEDPASNPVRGVWAQSDDSLIVTFNLRTIGGGGADGRLDVWISDPDSMNVDPDPPSVPVSIFDEATGSLVASGTAKIYGGVSFALAPGTYSAEIAVPAGYDLYPATQQNPATGLIVRSRQTTSSHFSIRRSS